MCRIILLIIALCTTLSSFATEQAKSLTLKEAILIALRFNPNIRNAELQRIIDKFRLEVAKNDFELRYALTASGQYNDQRSNSINSVDKGLGLNPSASIKTPSGADVSLNMDNKLGSAYYNPGLTLTVKQPLLRGFGSEITLNPLADAYDQEKVNKLNLKRTISNTITTIVSDYLRIVLAQNSLLTQQLALKNSIKEYEQNQLKIKAGKMAAADNIQQEASIASQRLALLQAQETLKRDKQQLLLDMGLEPNTEFSLVQHVTLPNETLPELMTAKQLILTNDIDYQTGLINRRIETRNLMVAKDNLRWKLDLTATASVGNGSGGDPNSGLVSLTNNQNYGRSLKLDLTVPIDDKKLQQSLVNAKIQLQKADIVLQQERYKLETDVINALRNLNIQKQQIQQSIIARDLAQRSLEVALKKLQFGLVSTFETTTLRTNLTNAELQVVNNQIGYLNTLAAFQQALGTTLDIWGINIRY